MDFLCFDQRFGRWWLFQKGIQYEGDWYWMGFHIQSHQVFTNHLVGRVSLKHPLWMPSPEMLLSQRRKKGFPTILLSYRTGEIYSMFLSLEKWCNWGPVLEPFPTCISYIVFLTTERGCGSFQQICTWVVSEESTSLQAHWQPWIWIVSSCGSTRLGSPGTSYVGLKQPNRCRRSLSDRCLSSHSGVTGRSMLCHRSMHPSMVRGGCRMAPCKMEGVGEGRKWKEWDMEGVGGGRNGRRNMEGVGGGRKRPHSPTQPLRPGKNMCQLTCLVMTPNILWRGANL